MKIISPYILLLLITLIMLPETNFYAEETDYTEIERQFDYDEVAKSKPSDYLREGEMELIRNNLKYVVITACSYAFSLIIITILMKMTPDHMAKDIVTAVGLVSVIFGAIILVLVVDTTDSLTAPMGILGAIAGYLFGAAQKPTSPAKNETPP